MSDIVKIVLPAMIAFIIGIGITPDLTRIMYAKRLWKRTAREEENEPMSADYDRFHNTDAEKRTPRVGGLIIWLSVVVTVLIFTLLPMVLENEIAEKLNFLSRNQTILIVAGLIVGSIIGLIDDLLHVYSVPFLKDSHHGISRNNFIVIVCGVGIFFALWFFLKLDVSAIYIPFVGYFGLGWVFVPFFILVLLGVFSSGVIDGIDGLAGGVMATVFAGYALIALLQNQIDIATLALVITSGILAFLWFNIPPARFYMGETGMLGLTISLTLIAFLTEQVLMLLVLAFPLVTTSFSSFVQIYSKKWFNIKVFKVAPIHHHFQVLGWSNERIAMRYWIVAVMCSMTGVILVVLSRSITG